MDNSPFLMTKHFIAFIFAISSISLFAQIEEKVQLANEYFVQGDTEKALSIFSNLAKNKKAIPGIHTNYFSLLMNRSEFDEAENYLDRAIKAYPNLYQYKVDLIFLLTTTDRTSDARSVFNSLKKQLANNQYQLNFIAQSFVTKELFDYAIDFLMQARQLNGRPGAYALDLATVHRLMGDKQSMVNEYLYYALANPGNLNYIKNIFQNLFAEEEDLVFLEQTLIKKIQREPEQKVYSELLIWIELQRKNFYAAFLQARALDKRSGRPGDESMRIGQIAMDNGAWEDAITIFEYVVKEFGRRSPNYGRARQQLIASKEGLVKSQFPIDERAIRTLTSEYQNLYNELGPNVITLEAMRNKALLHAFHLDERDEAVKILNDLLRIPRVSPYLTSKCKLDLGDIYLLEDEPWEASLLYSQVEKQNDDSPVGYEAKLRNAKLNYYIGAFALALSHLDILKQATTREISNDAISLSLLIKNNTILDTSDFVMREYAGVELLMFQNKYDSAMLSLKLLIENNPSHSIVDECLWLMSTIHRSQGEFTEAISVLDRILAEYSYDILADDAAFRKAEIVERSLQQKEEAKLLYREFLTAYPGSIYAAEARKRFRELRGDELY